MSVNTSDEYLDELLQAIEPIIYPDGPEAAEEPEMSVTPEPIVTPQPIVTPEPIVTLEPTVEPEPVMEAESGMESETPADSEPIAESNIAQVSDLSFLMGDQEEISADALAGDEMDLSAFFSMDEGISAPEKEKEESFVEPDDDVETIGDLLASLAAESDDAESDDSGMSEEDIESMLSAVSSQPEAETDSLAYNQDVKELLKQFTEDEDLSDIQDMLEKNDNGEALDNSLLDLPDVEVFRLEEDGDEDDAEQPESKGNVIGKLISGFTGFFKKRKNKKQKPEEDADSSMVISDNPTEEYSTNGDLNLTDLDEMSSLDSVTDDDVEELVLDEDMSDIEMLLSGGALQGSDFVDESKNRVEYIDEEKESKSDKKKSRKDKKAGKEKKAEKEKKETIFTKIFNMLTEEVEEGPKTKDGVPEADETGITNENLGILETLSKEDKKKNKKEAKQDKKKSKKNGKNASKKDGDDEGEEGKSKKAKKDKKPKKKREKKEKPRKVEVISKPEKKLPRKRVLSAFALCFSILAAVLILQNVVTKTSNIQEAEYAFDTADYETCFANLSGIERSEEEEALYQKSFIILSVQRKLDSYENFMLMNRKAEALNSLLEGVTAYREQEALALEWGVQGQIAAIYQTILEKLQEYGLSETDIDEILNYESKVTYTKRLDSIVNGTPFVIEDEADSVVEEALPLQDVLPGEEDFLPEDTTDVTAGQSSEEGSMSNESDSSDVYEEQHGQTVVVGSNPVDISDGEQSVTGGQNVGNGNTDLSIEMNGDSVVVGDL